MMISDGHRGCEEQDKIAVKGHISAKWARSINRAKPQRAKGRYDVKRWHVSHIDDQ